MLGWYEQSCSLLWCSTATFRRMILPRTSPTGLSLAHSYFSNSSFLQGNRKGSPGWRYSELSATVQIPGLQRATRPRDLRNDPEITGRKPIERPTLLRPSGKPTAPPPPAPTPTHPREHTPPPFLPSPPPLAEPRAPPRWRSAPRTAPRPLPPRPRVSRHPRPRDRLRE